MSSHGAHSHSSSASESAHGHSHGGNDDESSSHGHSHGEQKNAAGATSASDFSKMKIDKTRIFLLFSFVLIDVLGFSILLPLLPYICEKFGASPSILGLLFASNAIAQLVSAPTIGLLSDRFGRKKLLLICSTVTCVSFVWLLNAESLQDVFLSRILDGLLGGNISLAQAYVVDSTTAESRSLGLAVVGAAFGLAFLVGPVLGGTISRYSLLLPVQLACVLSVINFFGVYLLLPESLPVEKRRQRGGFIAYVPVANIIEQLQGPLGGLLLLRLLFGTLLALLETSVATVGRALMPEVSAQYLSYALASMALAYMLVQMGVMPVLSRRFSGAQLNPKLLKIGFVLLACALGLWGTATTLGQLYLALFLFGAASATISTTLNTLISQRARQQEVGSSMGVAAALGSLTRVIGPLLGGYLLQQLGGSAPGFFGVALSLLALLASGMVLQ